MWLRGTMSSRNTPTVPMDDDLLDAIDSQLDYGDSRAAWIREAVRQRLERETDESEVTPQQ